MKRKLLARSRANKPNVQCRFMQLSPENVRFVAPTKAGEPVKFSGYAVRWASINTHGEQFLKGAFADVINAVNAGSKKLHMYYNHSYLDFFNSQKIRIGKWVNIVEDDTGLLVEGELTPNLSLSNDIAAMLAHGTVDGLSIAFYEPNPMDYENQGDKTVIKRVDLYEISVVDEPSDRSARITEQDVEEIETVDDAKNMLRSIGINDSMINTLIARLSKQDKPATSTTVEDPLAFLDAI